MVQLSPPGWTRVLSAVLFLWLYSQEKTLEGTFGRQEKDLSGYGPPPLKRVHVAPFSPFPKTEGVCFNS